MNQYKVRNDAFLSMYMNFKSKTLINRIFFFVFQAKIQSPSGAPSTNPFLSSPTESGNEAIVDLFSSALASTTQVQIIIIIYY